MRPNPPHSQVTTDELLVQHLRRGRPFPTRHIAGAEHHVVRRPLPITALNQLLTLAPTGRVPAGLVDVLDRAVHSPGHVSASIRGRPVRPPTAWPRWPAWPVADAARGHIEQLPSGSFWAKVYARDRSPDRQAALPGQGPGKVGIRRRLSVDHGVAQRYATALAKPDATFPLQACSGILCRPRVCRGPGSRHDAFEGVEEQDKDPEGEPEGEQIDPGRERGAAA